ncbi:MAG: family 16 glycosylhydrolase [Pseudomonadota bacterium]
MSDQISSSRNAWFNVGKPIVLTIMLIYTVLCASFALAENSESAVNKELAMDTEVVWAVNIGGGAYTSEEGIHYQADNLESDAAKGTIERIRGVQDGTVYQTYREGITELRHKLVNGSYSIVFYFAEPKDIAKGDRVFDVLAQGKTVISEMDVRVARDGNHHSGLVRAVTDVVVTNGELVVSFKAADKPAILSAIVVRKEVDTQNKWQLVWQDEFDYEGAPDPEKWTHDIWPAKKVNDEDQAYTDRAKNVRVENGMLVIEAHKEDYQNAKYSSGRIHSLGKGDFLYGRAEVRAKLPAGQGSWAAIWMLPSDPFKYATTCAAGTDWQGSSDCDAWPNSGEIDIMEHVGYDMNRVHGTVHTRAYYWVNGEQRKASVEAKNVAEAFHEYAVEWTPERIDIFFNGSRYFTYLNQGEGWKAWPFDHPYHIILNLAVGGAWGRAGGPVDDSIFPAKMEVDYVRVYRAADEVAAE